MPKQIECVVAKQFKLTAAPHGISNRLHVAGQRIMLSQEAVDYLSQWNLVTLAAPAKAKPPKDAAKGRRASVQ